MSTTEFVAREHVTAAIRMDMEMGESYSGPIIIGHYGSHGAGEIFVDCEGYRINIPAAHFRDVMKQLKRAHEVAQQATKEGCAA